MITEVTTGLASSQASDTRAGLQPWAFAIGAIASRIFQVRSLSTIGKSNSARRVPSRLLIFAAEFSRKQSAGERAPDQ